MRGSGELKQSTTPETADNVRYDTFLSCFHPERPLIRNRQGYFLK